MTKPIKGLKIVSKKEYTVQVEYIEDLVIDFSSMNMTKSSFEKLSFRDKEKLIKQHAKAGDNHFKQLTDIEVKGKVW